MITVSFNCENHNDVLLLTTLYDILTVEDVDDSIAMIDFSSWLIDEVGSRLNEVDQFDIGNEEHGLKGLALEVAKLYALDRPQEG